MNPGPVELSVVMPAFNNGDLLALTLESLCRQTLPAERFEVLVADDGSEPSLEPVVGAFTDRLRVVALRHTPNRGRSATRNRALAAATGATIVFIDSDSCAHPDLLRRHLRFHTGRGGRPGVLVGRRYEVDWAAVEALRRGEALEPPLIGEYRDDNRDSVLLPEHRRRDWVRAPWIYAFTHNISVDRASVLAVGGFDEQIVDWGCEDHDLFYRIYHHHGARTGVFDMDGEAVCYHLPHFRSWPELVGQMQANHEYLRRKHRRFDMELFHLIGSFAVAVKRIAWYGDAFEVARSHGLGRVDHLPQDVRRELATQRSLVAGFGAAALALPPGSHTFDHDAAPSETNLHLVGLKTPFAAGAFERVVSVDLWRFLGPEDLGAFVLEGLRTADRVDLVASASEADAAALLPLPFVSRVDFVHDMMRHHFEVTVAGTDEMSVLTLRIRQSRR